MNLYLKIFLLSSSVFLYSCSTTRGFKASDLKIAEEISAPLADGYNIVLYKASIQIYDKHFSGIVLFKHTPAENRHNVVFLTEMGLSLFELEGINGKLAIQKQSAIFKSKSAVKTMMKDFELLIQNLNHSSNKLYSEKDGDMQLIKAKQEGKTFYWYNTDHQVYKIKNPDLITSIEVEVKNYQNNFPKTISFDHSGIKLNVDLTLLNVKQ